METIVDRLERRGVHRGRIEGIEIGERRGRSEGRLEERLEIAQKMKRDGFPIEIIMKYTDLSEEEIRAL